MVKKSFISNANKKATENFGQSKIYAIVDTLNSCGFHCKIDPTIKDEKFSTRNKIRNPDVVLTFDGMIAILESDGKVHGSLECPTKSTNERNKDFERTNRQYILINHEQVKVLKQVLGIVAKDEDLVHFISAYRACEEYCKHQAQRELKAENDQWRYYLAV